MKSNNHLKFCNYTAWDIISQVGVNNSGIITGIVKWGGAAAVAIGKALLQTVTQVEVDHLRMASLIIHHQILLMAIVDHLMMIKVETMGFQTCSLRAKF